MWRVTSMRVGLENKGLRIDMNSHKIKRFRKIGKSRRKSFPTRELQNRYSKTSMRQQVIKPEDRAACPWQI